MDLDKPSLIKTILNKLRSYFKSQPCDSVLNEFSEILKKCQFLKLRKLSNELFFELDKIDDENKINELIEDFKLNILKCTNENHKNHHNSENNNNENNICLSSDDDDYESQKSITSNEDDPKDDLYIESEDSDIEIIDAKETGGSHHNTRKRKSSNSKENINTIGGEQNFKQSRYEFRERRPNFSTSTTNNNINNEEKSSNNNSSQPQRNKTSNAGGTNNNHNNTKFSNKTNEEVIQIEDSSSDEDVQEIHCEESSSSRSTNFRQPRNKNSSAGGGFKFHMPTGAAPNDHPPTQADPSQLASIPFVVQFPTMRSSALFNGHLYISHNHKFSVKLQGIDPRNFRWN